MKSSPRARRRKRANWLRAYGSKERVEWVNSLPSVASGAVGTLDDPIVNAHVAPPGEHGTGYKGDACWIVPLLKSEHDMIHQHGIETFEAAYDVSLVREATFIEARWKAILRTGTEVREWVKQYGHINFHEGL